MRRPERDLTHLFMKRRDFNQRSHSNRRFQRQTSQSRVPLTDSLAAEEKQDAPDEPPAWVKFSVQFECNEDFKTLDDLLVRLAALNKQKLKPTFDDAEERRVNIQIQKQTRNFKNTMKSIERQIKKLAKKDDWSSVNEMRVGEAIASEMSTKLKAKSDKFRNIQRGFVKQMKRLQAGAEEAKGGPDGATVQTMLIGVSQDEIVDRHQEAEKIVKMISEVAEMFKDLHMLICEQGTIVDRIDYNLEIAAARTIKGTDELNKAAIHQEKASGRAIKCIAVQMCLITGLMVAWILNHRYG